MPLQELQLLQELQPLQELQLLHTWPQWAASCRPTIRNSGLGARPLLASLPAAGGRAAQQMARRAAVQGRVGVTSGASSGAASGLRVRPQQELAEGAQNGFRVGGRTGWLG